MTNRSKAQHRLFAYGTLRDPEVQLELFGHRCPGVPGRLIGWSVFSSDSGYLFIKPDPGGIVAGLVLEIGQADLLVADQWEDVPVYEREKLEVCLDDGATQPVWTYTRRDAMGSPFNGPGLSRHDRDAMLADVAEFRTSRAK